MSDITFEPYESEVQFLVEMLGKLQVKYGTRKATFENLNSMADEAMDMAMQKGLIVTVSVLDDNMQPKLPPEITVHGRVDEKDFEFDFDRQQWEVQKGVADEKKVKEILSKGGTTNQKAVVDSEITESEKQAE